MPIVTIHMMEGRDSKTREELARRVTEAICQSLGVEPQQVRIILQEMKTDNYAVGGVLWSRANSNRR